jgi:hypothetical protein
MIKNISICEALQGCTAELESLANSPDYAAIMKVFQAGIHVEEHIYWDWLIRARRGNGSAPVMFGTAYNMWEDTHKRDIETAEYMGATALMKKNAAYEQYHITATMPDGLHYENTTFGRIAAGLWFMYITHTHLTPSQNA